MSTVDWCYSEGKISDAPQENTAKWRGILGSNIEDILKRHPIATAVIIGGVLWGSHVHFFQKILEPHAYYTYKLKKDRQSEQEYTDKAFLAFRSSNPSYYEYDQKLQRAENAVAEDKKNLADTAPS